MFNISHGNRDELNHTAPCVVTYNGEPCVGPVVENSPIDLCARHLRIAYEYAQGLVDANWRDALREITRDVPKTAVQRRSWVYFIRKGDRIKIGYTTDPNKRFQTLRPDTVLHIEPGTMEDERTLHAQFADYWLGREWFSAVPEIYDYIAGRRTKTA